MEHLTLAGVTDDLAVPAGDLVSREPTVVAPETAVGDVARLMRTARVDAVLVDDTELGIVTGGDLRDRVLAEGLPPTAHVRDVATRPVVTLPDDAPLHAALRLLVDGGFRHLPLTRQGRPVGVITSRDVLRHQSRRPVPALRRIRGLDRLDDVAGHVEELAGTAGALVRDGVDPLHVARVVTHLNDALTDRVLALAEARLGPPPCPYAWLALGSEGRREQLLFTDQDNALVYAEAGAARADYFARLADLVVGTLHTAGFGPCPGGFMATAWCHPLAGWVDVAARWLAAPEAKALVEAEVFLDFRAIHGDLDLDPLHAALRRGTRSPVFLVQLARAATTFSPPLGTFGRVRTDDGHVDVKMGGTVPIVLLGRLYGLAAGSTARSTLDRLADAAADGRLSPARAALLGESYTFLMGLRLRAQLAAIASGRPLDNRIRHDDLSWLEQRRLRDTFRTINSTQRETSAAFHQD